MISKHHNNDNIPHLTIIEGIQVNFDVVDHILLRNSRVLCTFTPNKSFAQLLEID